MAGAFLYVIENTETDFVLLFSVRELSVTLPRQSHKPHKCASSKPAICQEARCLLLWHSQISKIGRVTQGVKLIGLAEGERVVDLTVLDQTEDTQEDTREED